MLSVFVFCVMCVVSVLSMCLIMMSGLVFGVGFLSVSVVSLSVV